MARILNTLIFGVAFSVFATSALAATLSQSERRGQRLAETNCGKCHATGLTGTSPNPKSPPFRTVGKRYQLEALEEALGEGIVVGHGGTGMPHFEFEPDDIADLISYLKRINTR